VLFYNLHVSSCINPLDSRGSYSATSNNMKLIHWPLMGGLLHLVQRGGAWAGCGPTQALPHCTKCNSPFINSQCANHCIVIWRSVALQFYVAIKVSVKFLFFWCRTTTYRAVSWL